VTQQSIGIGSAPNDGTGDPVRTAFDKCNKNFAELYQPQRRVTASPITVAATDVIINCAISSGSPTCTLPPSGSRGGVPLVFKDVGGHFAANNLTITAAASEFMDGLATIVLSTNYQRLKLLPVNDGVGVGWSIDQ
jgi:hypothetical protein